MNIMNTSVKLPQTTPSKQQSSTTLQYRGGTASRVSSTNRRAAITAPPVADAFSNETITATSPASALVLQTSATLSL